MVNNPPVAADDATATLEGLPVTIDVLANDSDADEDSLAIIAVGNPSHGGAKTDGTVIVYTPTLNFRGQDIFTYTISDGNGGHDTAIVTVTVRAKPIIYLPLVMQQYVSAPDLVIEHLIATNNNVQVVIKNQGDAPIVGVFWVEAYIDPHPVPTGVNQTWDQLCSQGLVWGITSAALPSLVAGGTLTLTVGDAYYRENLSEISWPLPVGTPVYAQVDSADIRTTYGAVLEKHEIVGAAYNNITGTLSTPDALSPVTERGEHGN